MDRYNRYDFRHDCYDFIARIRINIGDTTVSFFRGDDYDSRARKHNSCERQLLYLLQVNYGKVIQLRYLVFPTPRCCLLDVGQSEPILCLQIQTLSWFGALHCVEDWLTTLVNAHVPSR